MKRRYLQLILLLITSFPMWALPALDNGSLNEGSLNAVKITFLSWASGSAKVSYERAIPAWNQSAELCAGYIGAGRDKYHNHPNGATVRYGHKFYLSPRENHPLDGFYLRPECIWSHYFYDSSCEPESRTLADMTALIATAGVQWSWGHFILDGWFGGGPAWGTPSDTFYHHGFDLWHFLGSSNDHIAMSFSIRIGYCF